MSKKQSPPLEEQLLNYVADSDGCHLWRGLTYSNGYARLSGKKPNELRTKRVHVVVYERVNGPVPKGFMVCHTCDVKRCINEQHLWLGTGKDNQQDKWRKGRGVVRPLRGDNNSQSVVSEKAVAQIRKSTLPSGVLAARYGVTPLHIYRIRSGRRRNKV